MDTMKILDLFCGAGGAAMGYHQAADDLGIEHTITGIDIKPMPRYPFVFIQGDALEYLAAHGSEYDFIHASPPCQAYSKTKYLARDGYPELIAAARDVLAPLGKPFAIENVPGAPLLNPLLLCGEMFGLRTYRHRLFELSTGAPSIFLMHRPHGLRPNNLYGKPTGRTHMVNVVGKARYSGALADWREAMQIDWMTESEIAEAIPPAYTRYIGRQMFGVFQGRQI